MHYEWSGGASALFTQTPPLRRRPVSYLSMVLTFFPTSAEATCIRSLRRGLVELDLFFLLFSFLVWYYCWLISVHITANIHSCATLIVIAGFTLKV